MIEPKPKDSRPVLLEDIHTSAYFEDPFFSVWIFLVAPPRDVESFATAPLNAVYFKTTLFVLVLAEAVICLITFTFSLRGFGVVPISYLI